VPSGVTDPPSTATSKPPTTAGPPEMVREYLAEAPALMAEGPEKTTVGRAPVELLRWHCEQPTSARPEIPFW
jgi:hypothetical protein